MQKPAIPENETERLAALHRYALLDSRPDPVFDHITRLASAIFKTPIALVSLIDESRQFFKSRVGLDALETPRDVAFCAHAINDHEVMVVPDAHTDERFSDNPLVTGHPRVRFYAGAPLVTSDGYVLGTMCVIDHEKRQNLSDDEQEVLRELAGMVIAHIESLNTIGYADPVTGVASRTRLLSGIEQRIEDGQAEGLCLVVVDVLEPEAFNDLVATLGYAHADTFLVSAARIIKAIVEPEASLFHISGYRFAFLPLTTLFANVEAILGKLEAALASPIVCGALPIRTSTTMGVAVYPKDGANSLQLLRAAIHAARDARSNQLPWLRYVEATDQAYSRAYRLLSDLGDALQAGDQLKIVYQPKIEIGSGRCVGAEALLRWNHPKLGIVSPAEFIPLAEKTTLMRPLTDWVLSRVLERVVAWRAQGLDLRMAVNVSVVNLEDANFTKRLFRALSEFSVSRDNLEVELTEGALIRNLDSSQKQVAEMRRHGVHVSIDDFGTGYSSISYLKWLKVDAIKLDQSFVRNLDQSKEDQAIVRSVIELAHAMGTTVVAEGVENEETLNILAGFSCDYAQGYLISRPLDEEAFEGWFVRCRDVGPTTQGRI